MNLLGYKILKIKWQHNIDEATQEIAANRIKTRIKIIRLNNLVIEPSDIFNSSVISCRFCFRVAPSVLK